MLHMDPSTAPGVLDALWHAAPVLAPLASFSALLSVARKGGTKDAR
jgi:hypothetical protein